MSKVEKFSVQGLQVHGALSNRKLQLDWTISHWLCLPGVSTIFPVIIFLLQNCINGEKSNDASSGVIFRLVFNMFKRVDFERGQICIDSGGSSKTAINR